MLFHASNDKRSVSKVFATHFPTAAKSPHLDGLGFVFYLRANCRSTGNQSLPFLSVVPNTPLARLELVMDHAAKLLQTARNSNNKNP